jgi:hypothetical protein
VEVKQASKGESFKKYPHIQNGTFYKVVNLTGAFFGFYFKSLRSPCFVMFYSTQRHNGPRRHGEEFNRCVASSLCRCFTVPLLRCAAV